MCLECFVDLLSKSVETRKLDVLSDPCNLFVLSYVKQEEEVD